MRQFATVLVALLAVPGTSAAGTVSGHEFGLNAGDFTFRAGNGEANRVLVVERPDGQVRITDRAAPIRVRGDCERRGRHSAVCPRAEGKILVRLRQRDDRLRIRGFTAEAAFVRFVEAYGGDGSDVLVGGPGPDYLFGRDGRDRLRGRGDGDFVKGGSGADLIKGGGGHDTLDGGRGSDHIQGRADRDFIRGLRGDDLLKGGSGGDDIKGGKGDDHIRGRAGDDRILRGGRGHDVVRGGDGNDRLKGGRGADTLRGGVATDVLAGHRGADLLRGGGGGDKLKTGPGRDRARGGAGTDRALPRATDRISNVELVSVWRLDPGRGDALLHMSAEPDLAGRTAAYLASCAAPDGCEGTLVMTQVETGEELGRADFALAQSGEDAPQPIEVALGPEAEERVRTGTNVMVQLIPDPGGGIHALDWGYRTFMRDG